MNHYVFCGFPGVGKSVADGKRKDVFDFESHGYSHDVLTGKRNRKFPKNYIDAVEEHMQDNYRAIYLLSCHDEVLKELKARSIPYVIVLPYGDARNEYIKRYVSRGSSHEFVQRMYDNFYDWIFALAEDDAPKIYLGEGEYISDVLPM